jgi:HEAT repeat protein
VQCVRVKKWQFTPASVVVLFIKTRGVLSRNICMVARRFFIILFMTTIGCQHISQTRPVQASEKLTSEVELDREMKIYRSTLLDGKNEQIRIDAAMVMLFSEKPTARAILLEVLKQSENSAARMAICKALVQARSSDKPINNKGDFVEPLLNVFSSDIIAEAQLAAEATLLFEYEKVGPFLEELASNPSNPVVKRLNAVHALKLRPDKRAMIKLISLVDDPDKQVAAAAEQALHSLGIPVGRDTETRAQIIRELESKSKGEFLRDWLIRQEEQIRKMRNELNLWQGRYLSALGTIYDGMSDDEVRGKFLCQHLTGSETVVKLWVLEKLAQWRKGTNKPKLSLELQQALLKLISDESKDVRLKTARLLSLIWELDSAQQLLEQLNAEQDEEVKLELFVALGGACYYASLPTSAVKISPEIREQTLQWAVKYLNAQEPKKVQKAADVIMKLLEQDGLTAEQVDGYLNLLAERYEQQKNASDGDLRGELLGAMAGLCAQRSICRVQAAKHFAALFEQALTDEKELVRQAAVDGLIYVDKANALRKLRKSFVNDPSLVIRTKLINLAGESGGTEDLVWLADKIGAAEEAESSWQAMIAIFSRSDADVLEEWMIKLQAKAKQNKIISEQMSSFLQVAEQKAAAENKLQMLENVRAQLAELARKRKDFEQAAAYLMLMEKSAQAEEQRGEILSELLDVYLRWPKLDLASGLLQKSLAKKDLGSESLLVRTIQAYLDNPPEGADVSKVIQTIMAINLNPDQKRPMWRQQVERWAIGLKRNNNKVQELIKQER